MRLALYQPDMAQNVGSLIRLCACLDIKLDIIEPCGFPFDVRRIKQTAMDYMDHVQLTRHTSWDAFLETTGSARLCLLTTKGSQPHHQVSYAADDILLCGSESSGAPEHVHQRADLRLNIPLMPHARSFNMAMAATIVLSEALQQTARWPGQ